MDNKKVNIKNTMIFHHFIGNVSKTLLGNIKKMPNLGPPLAPPRGTLLKAFSVHVAVQGRPDAENVRFWGVWLQGPFLNRFQIIFRRVLDSKNVDLATERC